MKNLSLHQYNNEYQILEATPLYEKIQYLLSYYS
jgi:hypothetical protein